MLVKQKGDFPAICLRLCVILLVKLTPEVLEYLSNCIAVLSTGEKRNDLFAVSFLSSNFE
jgi:hypothetical protein